MLKKVILAAALAVSAAFATWDYYPVLEAGKGSVKGDLYYDWHHDWSHAGLKLGVRYSLIQNLEISLQDWGYQFWGETDCKGCANGGNGLRDMTLGGRYQITPMVNAFLDFILPVGSTDWDGPGTSTPGQDELALYLGAQFSMPTGVPGFKFGTEGGIFWGFEHDNWDRGLEIHMAGEVGYTIPNIGLTPFIGMKLKFRITESEWEGEDGKEYGDDDDGDNQFILWLGADYFVIPNQLDVSAKLFVRSGDHDNMGGDASGLNIGVEFFF